MMPACTVRYVVGEEPEFLQRTTSKSVQSFPGRHCLYYLGQHSDLSSAPEGITLSILQGDLVSKHPWGIKKMVRTKAVNDFSQKM